MELPLISNNCCRTVRMLAKHCVFFNANMDHPNGRLNLWGHHTDWWEMLLRRFAHINCRAGLPFKSKDGQLLSLRHRLTPFVVELPAKAHSAAAQSMHLVGRTFGSVFHRSRSRTRHVRNLWTNEQPTIPTARGKSVAASGILFSKNTNHALVIAHWQRVCCWDGCVVWPFGRRAGAMAKALQSRWIRVMS